MIKSKAIFVCAGLLFVLISGIIYIMMASTDAVVFQSEIENDERITKEGVIDTDINHLDEENVDAELDITQEIVHNDIVVYICGSVTKEGVYSLQEGARVYEALELAGGMTQEAQQGHINLARVLVDGESIYFPTQDEVKTIGLTWSEQTQPEDARININTASEEELTQLPGIGLAKAKAIIAYRKNNSMFKKIEDIMEVPGIKKNTFENIKEQISI